MTEAEPRYTDRFSSSTRQVLSFAQEEALRFNHNYMGTEHLLLGLIREGSIKEISERCNIPDLSKVRSAVEFIIGKGDRMVTGEIGYTPRTKHVFKLAVDEADRDETSSVSPNHLLRGLAREGEGIAAGVLESLGVSLEKLRLESQKMKGTEAKIEAEEVLKRLEAFFADPNIDQGKKAKVKSMLTGLLELAT